MKKLLIIIIPVFCLTFGCRIKKPLSENKPAAAQTAPEQSVTDFLDPSSWILGYFKREQLYRTPYCEWYLSGYDNYHPDNEAINKLLSIPVDSIKIKVVMGTWCPDSRREVPGFMHIIDLWKFPIERVTMIGVDMDKRSPVGEYESLNIKRVPTFIFYKNNIEAGRIIENPVASLEKDIVNILAKNKKQ